MVNELEIKDALKNARKELQILLDNNTGSNFEETNGTFADMEKRADEYEHEYAEPSSTIQGVCGWFDQIEKALEGPETLSPPVDKQTLAIDSNTAITMAKDALTRAEGLAGSDFDSIVDGILWDVIVLLKLVRQGASNHLLGQANMELNNSLAELRLAAQQQINTTLGLWKNG